MKAPDYLNYYARFLLGLFAVTLLLFPNPTNAYANWLKCYVDLDDTEIIMNQQVANPEDAPHTVGLQIASTENAEHFQESIRYPADTPSTWKVKINPPPALQGGTMQYVVEVLPIFNDVTTTDEEVEDAMFTYPKMCDGRRSFGRNYDEAVTLTLNGKADSVEVWAGWATGFGLVSLTPKMILFRETTEEEEL